MADLTPITGCSGCATSAGRLGCAMHGTMAPKIGWVPLPPQHHDPWHRDEYEVIPGKRISRNGDIGPWADDEFSEPIYRKVD